jgi:imidazolonepropionase-like amidohydrolase
MVTINPAAALRQADSLGRIRRGFLADLIAVPCGGDTPDALEKIIASQGKLPWRMIDGVVHA